MNIYSGAHSMKFGGEYRVDRGKGARFEPITFNIKQAITANANSSPNLNNASVAAGQPSSGSEWATFMLGFIDNASIAARVPIQEAVTLGYAGYVMDDYKVNKNLTLNLGLRWEYEPGPVDRGNRISQQLDLTQPIPEMQTTPPAIPAAVTALLASKNEKQLFNGAWIFANASSRSAWHRKLANFFPRLGGAYRIGDRSVFRFGWGRYISPSSRIRDPLGDFVNQYAGFSTSTPGATLAVVAGNGQTGWFHARRYPTRGRLRSVRFNNRWVNHWAVTRTWEIRLARRAMPLTASTSTTCCRLLTIASACHSSAKSGPSSSWTLATSIITVRTIPYAVDLNMADPAFSYETPKSVFNLSVTNPFFNYLTPDKFPGTLRTQSTITQGALLRPYPQYGVINQTNTSGKGEHLHSFEFSVQRPFTKGLSVYAAYAYQREQTQEFFDDLATYARRFEWRDTDTPRAAFHHRRQLGHPDRQGPRLSQQRAQGRGLHRRWLDAHDFDAYLFGPAVVLQPKPDRYRQPEDQ